MSVANTIQALEQFCTNNSGKANVWQGKSATYQWNVGRQSIDGIVNGVVRKLAGVDAANHQIWVVAGSFKIAADGSIVRFTGISKKDQKLISGISAIQTAARVKVTQTV